LPLIVARTYGCGGVEITGSQKCRTVGKSQPVLMMIDPIISTRARIAIEANKCIGAHAWRWGLSQPLPLAVAREGVAHIFGEDALHQLALVAVCERELAAEEAVPAPQGHLIEAPWLANSGHGLRDWPTAHQ
jgi:hypothetical protein